MRYGSLLDYDELKNHGFGKDKISKIFDEDKAYLENVENFYEDNHKKREYMFGYPRIWKTIPVCLPIFVI